MAYESLSSINLSLINRDVPTLRNQPTQSLLPEDEQDCTQSKSIRRRYLVHLSFLWLLIPTCLAVADLVVNARQIAFSGRIYTLVTNNRASTSIAVQVLSVGLGLIQATAVSQLFNLSTRISLRSNPLPLQKLQFWNGISSGTIQWNSRPKHFLLLCVYVGLCAVPGAIWSGALTPVVTATDRTIAIRISQYSDMTSVREWPSEISRSGPFLKNQKGAFSYSVGIMFVGQLTQSLASATTIDGTPRHHVKFDNSDYIYIGRSYGVGSSAGLVDDHILNNPYARSYRYQENGYSTKVTCGRNNSRQFFRISGPEGSMLYPARGRLSDSTGEEYSVYIGHSTDAIVAFGVAAGPILMSSTTRYVGIAAGKSYANLNATECKLEMIPSRFDVTVDLGGRNITATRQNTTDVPDIEPSGNLTHVVTRQIELYSNDLTNIYQSVAGNALNFSITDYNTFVSHTNGKNIPDSLDGNTLSLRGIENSFTAMMDDLLVGYASAQLMIANDTVEVPATMSLNAIRVGKPIYIYLVFGISTVVLLLVAEEMARTHFWRNLPDFDYADLTQLVVASSRGGVGLANMTSRSANAMNQFEGSILNQQSKNRYMPGPWQQSANVRILLRQEDEVGVISSGRSDRYRISAV